MFEFNEFHTGKKKKIVATVGFGKCTTQNPSVMMCCLAELAALLLFLEILPNQYLSKDEYHRFLFL